MKNFLKKLDNFWYHYKWHTIFSVFFLGLILICTVQCMQKDDPDAMILYSGPEVLTAEGQDTVGALFAQRLEKDHNDDGKKLVTVTSVVILSDEQIEEKKAEAKEEGTTLFYDPTQRSSAVSEVKNWLVSGQMMIAILDPFVYDALNQVEGVSLFVPLADVFGELPDTAYNDYAISMDKLDFIQYNPELKEAFSGALICLVKPTVSSTFDTSWYEKHLALFRRIVSFEVVS